jgi:site-specific DNA-methyltransferase (adenine-specific)
MECVAGMKKLPDGFVDLTVTSPPYDNLRTYNGFAWDFETTAKELYRITKDGGVVVWVVGDATIKGSETGSSFRQALYFQSIGFNIHDTMIYQKPAVPFDPKCHRYWQCFEYMFVFSKGKPICNYIKEPCKNAGKQKTNDYGQKRYDGSIRTDRHNSERVIKDDKVKSNIWFYTAGNRVEGHPAQFPEQLASDHILSWSNHGDLVFDPFMGSGTTAKMAVANGRKFLGFDLSEEYCKLAKSRVNQYIIEHNLQDSYSEIA